MSTLPPRLYQMVRSKMAASVLKRCVTAAVKVKGLAHSFTARRRLLSAAYTDTKLWDEREKEPQNLAVLANLMDRTYDRNLPVSSLTISRFVDNISCREEVDQAEYYLYKYEESFFLSSASSYLLNICCFLIFFLFVVPTSVFFLD
ncbi:hypothetical protein ILYODFUR_006513 [Ilyodon furcidens]|uniref:Mitochondrial ribosomal protein S27 n=1 Tax=Ilyodon furcidens TaxID=33524 RepID=A0ABV0SJD4_9TELE